MGTWARLSAEYAREHGYEPDPEFLEALRPVALRQAAEMMIDRYGLSESVDEIVDIFLDRVGYFFDNVFELKPGVRAFVRALRERGIPCCVATAAERTHTEKALTRLDLIDAFDFLLTTNEVGKSKMFPDIFLTSAERLGVPAKACVVFEDSLMRSFDPLYFDPLYEVIMSRAFVALSLIGIYFLHDRISFCSIIACNPGNCKSRMYHDVENILINFHFL